MDSYVTFEALLKQSQNVPADAHTKPNAKRAPHKGVNTTVEVIAVAVFEDDA